MKRKIITIGVISDTHGLLRPKQSRPSRDLISLFMQEMLAILRFSLNWSELLL